MILPFESRPYLELLFLSKTEFQFTLININFRLESNLLELPAFLEKLINSFSSTLSVSGNMNTVLKIILGAIMVIGGIYWYVAPKVMGIAMGGANLSALITILRGSIGVLIFLIGVFIVWIEADELKMEKEIEEFDEPEFETEEEEEETEEVKAAVTGGSEEDSEIESEENEEVHECDICGKEFETERGLKIHMGREHPEEK